MLARKLKASDENADASLGADVRLPRPVRTGPPLRAAGRANATAIGLPDHP